MLKKRKVLTIIPARAGSKGVPGKNLKELGGQPLISYPIRLALSVEGIDRVVVSSESQDIRRMARRYGAETPFCRPKSLARDKTPTLPVLQHCVKYLETEEGYHADYVLLLYPTNPFLEKTHIQKALRLLRQSSRSCVVSVEKDFGTFWQHTCAEQRPTLFYPKQRVNRQWKKPLYRENGALYAVDTITLMRHDTLVDPRHIRFMEMRPGELIDIDTMDDWERAQERAKTWPKKLDFKI